MCRKSIVHISRGLKSHNSAAP